jgi:hypothetical protein
LLLSVNLDMRLKEYDRALATAQRVQAVHVVTYTAESIAVADDLLRMGQIYLVQGTPVEAMRPLLAAEGVRNRLNESLNPGLLPVLDRLGEASTAIAGPAGVHSRVMPTRDSTARR